MSNRKIAHGVRVALMTAGALGAGLYGVTSAAQEQLEEIVVTGSRIQRANNLTAPTAITTVGSEDIAQSGLINVADVLRTVPSFGVSGISSGNSNFTTSSSGINTLQLRNLDEDRTLVLVNGRRYVSGVAGSSAVDFNTIPTELVERIEVITGGASAIYGSDALAGVINVILKDNYEGVGFSYQYGAADDGGEIENRFSFTAGGNFADDRGNAVVSATYSENKGTFARQRSNTAVDDIALCRLTSLIADCKTSQEPFFSSFSEFGRFFVPSTGASFTISEGAGPTGTVVPYNNAVYGFNRQAFRRYTVPTERFLVSALMDYEMGSGISAFAEATFAQTRTSTELEPFPHSNSDANIAGISVDNPFVPPALRAAVVAAGDDVIEYFRRTTELGNRGASATRNTYRFLGGLEGSLFDNWKWETFMSYGRMDDAQQGGGQINVLALREALNVIDGDGNPATFDPICASESARLEGCVPINFFGRGSISEDAAAYVRAPTSRQQFTEQQVWGANINGSVFELPAGPLGVAVGLEYRDERAADVPDVLTQRGLNAGNAEAPVRGGYNVKEAFVEFDAPLMRDRTGVYELSLGGAYRHSDYNTVGTTDAYAGRLSYAPIESLRFRAQYARAVRAPNISELFAPGGENFAPVSDPCNGVTATTAGNVAENCRSIAAIAQRIAATGSFTLTQTEIQGTGGFTGKGNPALDVETSDSWTVGAVFNKDFGRAGDMSLSVDYFTIEIEDLIDTVGRQTTVDFCFNTPPSNFPNQFCPFLTRDTRGAAFQQGELTEVNSGFVNEGTLETEGVDVAVTWGWDLDTLGQLGVRLNYTRLLDFTETKFGVVDDIAGEVGLAEDRVQLGTTWNLGPWMANWEVSYIGDSTVDRSNALFNFKVGSYMVHDLQVAYSFAESRWAETTMGGARIYLGVRNVLDEDAPKILSGIPGNITGTDTGGPYDPIGRAWYAGISFKL